MNDTEFAELVERQNIAHSKGCDVNKYTCYCCLQDGLREGESTYLNWPIYFDSNGNPLCDMHGKRLEVNCRVEVK